MADRPLVLAERRGEVAVWTLNRPEKMNALDMALVRALRRRVEEAAGDDGLRAVIITGAGDHFAAGADVAELERRGAAEALASINGSLFQAVEDLPVPVIAAIEGYALGGGCELALACDLRVAGETAVLGQPEVGLGIVPGAGATYRLPRIVGLGRAKELIYTGRRVGAAEALAMGLVGSVAPAGEALKSAHDLADRILRNGAQAVRAAKLLLDSGHDRSGSTLERLAQAFLFESDDKRERMRRFLEKKPRS
jgi:enoyl-CoA hydratase